MSLAFAGDRYRLLGASGIRASVIGIWNAGDGRAEALARVRRGVEALGEPLKEKVNA